MMFSLHLTSRIRTNVVVLFLSCLLYTDSISGRCLALGGCIHRTRTGIRLLAAWPSGMLILFFVTKYCFYFSVVAPGFMYVILPKCRDFLKSWKLRSRKPLCKRPRRRTRGWGRSRAWFRYVNKHASFTTLIKITCRLKVFFVFLIVQ